MDKVRSKKSQEQLDNNINVTNEYSVYEYLKKTPSVLIAGGSAVVAVVTFLARLITNINVRKTLIFWSIDTNNINMDNSALIFQSLMSIFYILLIAIIVICVDSIYKSHVPIKKYKFANKCLKKKFKSKKQTKEYQEYIKYYKKTRKPLNIIYFFKMVGVFMLSFIGSSLYVFTSSTENKHLILAILMCTIIQFSLFLVLSKSKSNSINKKEIKSDCEKGDFEKYLLLEGFDSTGKDKSIRNHFTNKNLSLFAIQIIVSCLFICVSSIFLPVKKINQNTNVQIVALNSQEYIVVYQDGEKFFMKEIEVMVDEESEREILVIHQDKQTILTADSLDIEIRRYEDIRILEIGEEYK